MRVIAYDIDGVLTTHEGINEYRRREDNDDITGIVSARTSRDIESFINDKNISPDFKESALLKGIKLRRLKSKHDADEYIYYGSWFKDRVQAAIAGWEYKQI